MKMKNVRVHFERTPTFTTNLKCYVIEYCRTTSIHGMRFLGERGRSIPERIWWLVIVTISLWFCSDLILKTYQKWEKSPVIVTFATGQTPIWTIPFPAITICPETKTNPSIFNFTQIHFKKMHGQLDQNETVLYEFMKLLCVNANIIQTKCDQQEYLDEKALEFITEVAPAFTDIFLDCRRTENLHRSCKYLTPIVTDSGVCYTFNILDRSEMFSDDVYHYKNYHRTNSSRGWSIEEGFSENLDASYPQRAYSSGAKAGLTLNLYSLKTNKDHCCTTGLQGYKVHVHHPADVPRVEENYFRLSPDEVVNAAVKPNMMITNDKLLRYKPQERQCYFPKEKTLRFFKVYSQQNCYVECLTNFTLNSCHCVAFHMPRMNSTKICGSANVDCLIQAEEKFLANDEATEANRKNPNRICNCLPSCFSTNYDVEVSQTRVEWEKCSNNSKMDKHKYKLIIYFKERQFLSSERNELYGQTDFLANCGGLLSLFIGFSFISVMEVVYFFTLRLWHNLRKYGRHYWSGDQELLGDDYRK